MKLTTISEISRKMNISTRTLRYYEQIGLIESVKKEDYAYRTYDQTTVMRLQQIVVLRKLRIPLKPVSYTHLGEHEHHDGIEAELHKRIVDSQDFFRPREIGADILRRG